MSTKQEVISDEAAKERTPSSRAKSTLMDVARRANVSHITVSRFFNEPEKLTPATRERVLEAVEELNYVPNAAAKTLAQGSSQLLALIVTDLSNSFFSNLARGVEDVSREHGFTIILGNTDENAETEHNYVKLLLAHQVRGVVLAPTSGAVRNLELLRRYRIPLVTVDRELAGVESDVVRGDTYQGMADLVRHMVDHGYRTITFVGGQADLSSLQDRLSGYRDAVHGAGLNEEVHLGRYDRQTGIDAVDRMVDEGNIPDAIVAANSKVVVGVFEALRAHGLRVPENVAVGSMDDLEAAAIDPMLTVAEQPAYEIGRRAMEMLLERVSGHQKPARKIVLPLRLIVRSSCGCR